MTSGYNPNPPDLSDFLFANGCEQMIRARHDLLGSPESSASRYDETLLEAIAAAMGRVPCRMGRFSEPGDEEEHRMEQAVAALDAIEAYWLRVSA